jgi:ketosteroid isomerase-like protein
MRGEQQDETARPAAERVRAWVGELADAWRRCDADAALGLFAEDAVYRALPFDEPLRGREAIRSYLVETMGELHDVRVWFGEPAVSGAWATVEWWVSVEYGDDPATTAGASLFRLAEDGLCRELHEYAVTENGRIAPYEGWAHEP